MRIALASDHAGYDLKTAVARELAARGIGAEDFGSGPGETADYVDTAEKALRAVRSGAFDRAVLVCGTGMGMAVVGNKFRGIRATVCWNPVTAEMSRRHNDSNCLALGGRVLTEAEGLAILRIWLETPFDGGRHERRLAKIADLEERNCRP
jgi:ribose 5-phosphate isomerase B